MDAPPAEELLKKIQELEAGHAHLKQEMTKLKLSGGATDPKFEQGHQRSHSVSPRRSRLATTRSKASGGFDGAAAWKNGSASFRHSSPLQRESRSQEHLSPGGGGPSAVNFTGRQYLNILQSMGQSVHIFDLNGQIIYWNRTAEHLYGYSASEALRQDAIELLTDVRDSAVANDVIHRVTMGESWTGQFPVKNKLGERFLAIATNTPFYDDEGKLVGIICVSSDSRPFREMRVALSDTKPSEAHSSFSRPRSSHTNKLGLDPQQPLQVAIASKISNLAAKVTNKVRSRRRTGEGSVDHESGGGDSHYSDQGFSDVVLSDHREDATSSGASTPRGDGPPSPFGVVSQAAHEEKSPGQPLRDSGMGEGKTGIHKIIASKAEAWISKKGMSWSWKGNERDGPEARTARFSWPWLNHDQENDLGQQKSSDTGANLESQVGEGNWTGNKEASGSWSSSFNVNSTSSVSSSGSTCSSAVHKMDMENDCLDYEILWEDLTIREQIGQG